MSKYMKIFERVLNEQMSRNAISFDNNILCQIHIVSIVFQYSDT